MFGHLFVFSLYFDHDVCHQFLSTTQRSGCWQKFMVKHPKWGHNLTSHTWEISQRNWKNIDSTMVNNHTHPFLNIIVCSKTFWYVSNWCLLLQQVLDYREDWVKKKIPIIKVNIRYRHTKNIPTMMFKIGCVWIN